MHSVAGWYFFDVPLLVPIWLRVLIVLAISSAAFVLWFLRYRQNSELEHLRRYLQSAEVLHDKVLSLRFQSPAIQEVWRTLCARERSREDDRQTKAVFDEALALGERLAGAADFEGTVGTAICEVLLEAGAPEVAAVAVALRDEQSGPQLLAVHGLSEIRTAAPLLMCFDQVFDGRDECGWGYQVPAPGSPFDFRTFGVYQSLLVPLRQHNEVVGGIWMGFRDRANGLTKDRKEVVRALAEHAAASFGAARRAADRSAEAGRERDFLLGLSHDLRSPSNRALFALRSLLLEFGGKLPPVQLAQVHVAEAAIGEQLRLLSDVLDLASDRRGHLTARPEPVMLDEVLAEPLRVYREAAEHRKLQFVIPKIPKVSIEVDPRQFRRMIDNLLSNAMKYTDHGEIRLEVSLGEGRVTLCVADTGIGVPPDAREQLFSEFRRAANTGNRDGIGLGLALTKALAKVNGASLRYEPAHGGGSRFLLGVRRAVNETGVGVDHYRPALARSNVPSILIIDDDPLARRWYARVFAGQRFSLAFAHDISSARRALSRMPWDILVADYHLGDGNLGQLLEHIPPSAALIVVTGSTSGYLPLEACAVVEKPVNTADLMKAIDSVLASRDEAEKKVA
ncbi:MAG: hybrid sensor histidine kinase/response regulator [Bdellovibrionales bacterium]|nr:hybrid sensor histidine kinase/response regulator [Bdellovibrionales bacterium]